MSTTRATELFRYANGNTLVSLLSDGTKTRTWEGVAVPVHPESIDVKLTDYCDLGCEFCHESSTVLGKHASVEAVRQVIAGLPAGVELAIGGGNPLDHPDLVPILQDMRAQGLVPNITINQGHLKKHAGLIRRLIEERMVYGVGVSITSRNMKLLDEVCNTTNNVVFHVIAGVHEPSILDDLMAFREPKVLVLGYKRFGRGVDHWSPQTQVRIERWKRRLPNYIRKLSLSFDNLAIEQLNVRRCFTQEGWERFYMGDDFTFTMYADAVKMEFAPTSRSHERTAFGNLSAIDFFRTRSQ